MAEIKCIYVKTSKEGFLCASTLLIRSIPCSHWAGSMENAQLLLGQWLPILLAGQNHLENFLFYFILFYFGAVPVAYGSSQARG